MMIPPSDLQVGKDYFVRFHYLLRLCEISHVSLVINASRVKASACLFG